MSDPMLDEMKRAKDVRDGIVQKWAAYFDALLDAKDAEIASLRAQLDAQTRTKKAVAHGA